MMRLLRDEVPRIWSRLARTRSCGLAGLDKHSFHIPAKLFQQCIFVRKIRNALETCGNWNHSLFFLEKGRFFLTTMRDSSKTRKKFKSCAAKLSIINIWSNLTYTNYFFLNPSTTFDARRASKLIEQLDWHFLSSSPPEFPVIPETPTVLNSIRRLI